MKIAIACDHGALGLKAAVKNYLLENGHEVLDFGTNSLDSCDYPDYVAPAAKAVAAGECERGIVLCSTGIGVSIAANKVKGVRASVCGDTFSAEMTRRHNNANILCMGARVIGEEIMLCVLDAFMKAPFDGITEEGARHLKRVNKILAMEEEF